MIFWNLKATSGDIPSLTGLYILILYKQFYQVGIIQIYDPMETIAYPNHHTSPITFNLIFSDMVTPWSCIGLTHSVRFYMPDPGMFQSNTMYLDFEKWIQKINPRSSWLSYKKLTEVSISLAPQTTPQFWTIGFLNR